MSSGYLLDTHALVHWQNRQRISLTFADVLDNAARDGLVKVATVSFWEIALLVKKGRLAIEDPVAWKNELAAASGIDVIDPSADEMIQSTRLPDHHGDPFDRLLVAIARRRKLALVTADELIRRYQVETRWEE